MDINQIRAAVNSLAPSQLQNFADDAQVRQGVAFLLGKPIREHLLAATMQLIHERLVSLGIKPRFKEPRKPRIVSPIISKAIASRGRNSRVKVTEVSPERMEELWK